MSSEIAIKVENLSKCYQIYEQPRDRLKQFILPRLQHMVGLPSKQYFHEFWALRDVSFEVKRGETVGIIGHNGSGKSTLLQMICGTLNPTAGNVQTYGRIAALLELGSGFNPEFTGRENIYMNGAVLGLTRAEIDRRYDDIAAFADIGGFIEQPVKTYSSGMMVRLAFAVSIKVEPDLMIVDEALAVGDMRFQAKCMTALSRIQDSGTTVVFVSHDIRAVKSLCRQAVYLEHGQLKAVGSASEIAEQYVRRMREEMTTDIRTFSRISEATPESKPKTEDTSDVTIVDNIIFKRSDAFDNRVATHRYGSGGARIAYIEMLNTDGSSVDMIDFDELIEIRIYFEVLEDMQVTVAFQVLDDKRNNITGAGLRELGEELITGTNGSRHVVIYKLKLPLRDGNYCIQAHLARPVAGHTRPDYVDVLPEAIVFKVAERNPVKIHYSVYLNPNVEIRRF